MKSIKDIVTKPSEAIQAMLDGLLESKNWKNFVVNMDTYGASTSEVCYGCAATCAVFKVAQKTPTLKSLGSPMSRYGEFPFEDEEIGFFESAINQVRLGSLYPLFRFYNIGESHSAKRHDGRFHFDQSLYKKWEEQVPEVEKLIADLQKEGF